MNTNSNQPVAIVTGGGRGIGAACCRMLAENGFRVGVHFNTSSDGATGVCSELNGNGFMINADLSDVDQVERMLQDIKKSEGRLDVLVNNAGISVNNAMSVMPIEGFDRQRSVTRGVWYLVKRALRLFMLRKNSGRIINISSVTGHTGNPGHIPYTMEKAAMDAMTKSLAKELAGKNILVNSVAPGFIDTDMTRELTDEVRQALMATIPMGRMGTPEEVADVVSFLATRGDYINGSVIHINGGIYG